MALDPNNLLSYSVWLGLTLETRWKIANLFGIKANGIRETVDNKVISDGFRHKDLAIITKERMSEITGVKSDDFYILFNALVDFVEGKINASKNANQNVQQEEQKTEVRPITTKKRGRPAKGGK